MMPGIGARLPIPVEKKPGWGKGNGGQGKREPFAKRLNRTFEGVDPQPAVSRPVQGCVERGGLLSQETLHPPPELLRKPHSHPTHPLACVFHYRGRFQTLSMEMG